MRHEVLEFASTLGTDDEVVLEATGNTRPSCGCSSRMPASSSRPVAGARDRNAKVKTDRIGLYSRGCMRQASCQNLAAREATEFLRRLVARRAGIVKGMTRTKNRIHAVLHATLIPPYHGKLFMAPGRKWLGESPGR